MKKILIFLIIFYSGCGNDSRNTENYGDVAKSPGGVNIVDQAEHVGGYGRADCIVCHNISLNVHRNVGTVIDADRLNEQAAKNGDSQYCTVCHGNNGT